MGRAFRDAEASAAVGSPLEEGAPGAAGGTTLPGADWALMLHPAPTGRASAVDRAGSHRLTGRFDLRMPPVRLSVGGVHREKARAGGAGAPPAVRRFAGFQRPLQPADHGGGEPDAFGEGGCLRAARLVLLRVPGGGGVGAPGPSLGSLWLRHGLAACWGAAHNTRAYNRAACARTGRVPPPARVCLAGMAPALSTTVPHTHAGDPTGDRAVPGGAAARLRAPVQAGPRQLHAPQEAGPVMWCDRVASRCCPGVLRCGAGFGLVWSGLVHPLPAVCPVHTGGC